MSNKSLHRQWAFLKIMQNVSNIFTIYKKCDRIKITKSKEHKKWELVLYVQSEGEIDTWNEIALDKLKSNLSDVGLPSDSEFIRVIYVMNCCKSYDEVFEYAKKVNFSNELFTDEEGTLTVYSQRLDYKYLGCTIYDMCRSQLKPNGDYSSTSEYVCEIWLMK